MVADHARKPAARPQRTLRFGHRRRAPELCRTTPDAVFASSSASGGETHMARPRRADGSQSRGSSARMRDPPPFDVMSMDPPISAARSRMEDSPTPGTQAASDAPASRTVTTSWSCSWLIREPDLVGAAVTSRVRHGLGRDPDRPRPRPMPAAVGSSSASTTTCIGAPGRGPRDVPTCWRSAATRPSSSSAGGRMS